jgi:hypothetical protein
VRRTGRGLSGWRVAAAPPALRGSCPCTRG